MSKKEIVVEYKNIGKGAVHMDTVYSAITDLDCKPGDVLSYRKYKGWKRRKINKNDFVEVVHTRKIKSSDSLHKNVFDRVHRKQIVTTSGTKRRPFEKLLEEKLSKENIYEVMKWIEDYEAELFKGLSDYDKKLNVIVHNIEKEKFNACEGYYFANEIQILRQRRRLIKVELQKVRKAKETFNYNTYLDRFKNSLQNLDKNSWYENFKEKELVI